MWARVATRAGVSSGLALAALGLVGCGQQSAATAAPRTHTITLSGYLSWDGVMPQPTAAGAGPGAYDPAVAVTICRSKASVLLATAPDIVIRSAGGEFFGRGATDPASIQTVPGPGNAKDVSAFHCRLSWRSGPLPDAASYSVTFGAQTKPVDRGDFAEPIELTW